MKDTGKTRITSLLLALLMLVSVLSQVTVPVFAQEEGTESEAMTGDPAVSQVLLQSEPEEQEPLAGKTIACVGDSITAAYGVTRDETDYVTLLAQRLGMNYIRLGDSGTTLCTDGSRVCNIRRLTEDQLQGADVVTIAMGINDFCNAAGDYYKLGDINTTDTSTIYGAARMWCQRIAELRKTDSLSNTRFYFVTPVITSWNNSVTSARDWDQSKKNVHGYTLRDLCNAIIEVAELYEVPVIDLNLLSGMYYVDAEDQNTAVFGGDGVHPGVKGHEMMANALANVLLQNHLRNDHEHTFGSWITTTWPSCTAGEQQRICSICSAAESRMAEPNDTHSYIPAVTPPTCTEQGYTTYTCTVCGDSYVDDYTNVRPLNILMIGNSFSWDAADFWYDMQTSMTYDAMKAMLADTYDVHFAVMYQGSATLGYHATCAANNTGTYTFQEIGPETNYTWQPSDGRNATNKILEHLQERDWDIIVIQSYQHEADGTEPRSTYTGGSAQFEEPSASLGFLLDYFAQNEPSAEVYYYMPWSSVKFYGAEETAAGFEAIGEYTKAQIVHMTGDSSGKKISGIIPVGTAIENARTTYLHSLKYSAGTGATALLKDPQIGLLYDTQHLSFGVGRYIAGLTVAQSLIPQEMQKACIVWPCVKDSPAVGILPAEYSQIAQKAVENAMQNPYAITPISGYDTDPADRVCEAITAADFTGSNLTDEASVRTHLETTIRTLLASWGDTDFALMLHDYSLKNGKLWNLDAEVTLRIGYTTSMVQIFVTEGTTHQFGDWVHVKVPSAASLGLDQRVCAQCGYVQSTEVEGAWQKYNLADHLQKLPDSFCCQTNLWSLLEPESVMIDHLGNWVSAGVYVHSVTIPVKPGDRIYANSFGLTSSTRGIQVSFIGDYGIVKTTFSGGTYQEFTNNGGYLVAPEDAIAVNVPVWDYRSDNELYILNAEHSYTAAVTPPTCTEQGYTTYTCTACGDSYISDTTELVWHSYSDGRCSMCGNEMLRVSLEDIVRFQGGVNSADGTLNGTFTNNWYADIPIPEGAEQVRFLVFKTGGSWGSAFLKGSTYLSGFCDKTSGGYWMSVDVPEDATIFRYGYLYDQIAAQAGYPTFAYLEFVGEDLTIQESSGSLDRPATGCHSFSVKVNIAPAQGEPDGYVEGTDYGYIQLPTNYTSYGEPTRLIIVCHGAGADLGTYRSDAWKNTNYSFWTDLGYAVMDMYACPPELTGNNDCLHYGNPVVLECYQEGYDYVMEHFNLKKDGIFLIGASMGGLSSFQIAQSGEFPVIAQVGYCPVIDLFKQAYVNPWTTASYQRSRIAQYFGFTGTAPAFTNAQFPSGEEIVYYKDNFCKTISYSPILSNVVSGDLEGLFDVIPASATAMSPEEEALYQKLAATHPNPLMIFHNTDDAAVSYRYSRYFVDMVNRSGQEAILRTFPSGGHNAWANGNDHTVQGLNGTITIKDSQYEAYLFFKKYEEHESHIGWVDPAMAPTCTTAGLTEGSHCAACGEVLLKQEIVSATGHYFTDYRPNGDGTLTGHCSRCGVPDTLPDPAIRSRINSIAVADETGAPWNDIPAGVCQVTVSVTNVAMEGDFVLWLAAYTAQEQFVCMVPLAVENLDAGETRSLTAQLDNTAGLMERLKAFCVESCEHPAPQGLEKAFLPR